MTRLSLVKPPRRPKRDRNDVTFLHGAAKQGDVEAQITLAGLYDHGYGLAKDMGLAAQWYLEAARQGSVQAQAIIGTKYLKGIGVNQDFEIAFKWLLKAAGKDNPDALVELAWAYQAGLGASIAAKRFWQRISSFHEISYASGMLVPVRSS